MEKENSTGKPVRYVAPSPDQRVNGNTGNTNDDSDDEDPTGEYIEVKSCIHQFDVVLYKVEWTFTAVTCKSHVRKKIG